MSFFGLMKNTPTLLLKAAVVRPIYTFFSGHGTLFAPDLITRGLPDWLERAEKNRTCKNIRNDMM